MMKRSFCLLLFATLSVLARAQKPSEKTITEIKEEGAALYTLEMANGSSLDLFYDNEFVKNGIKGYFSYKEQPKPTGKKKKDKDKPAPIDSIRTIFYAMIDTASPQFRQQPDSVKKKYKTDVDYITVVHAFAYGTSVNKKKGILTDVSRPLTDYEKVLMDGRLKIQKEFESDTAKYKHYEGTTMSLIPLDYGKVIRYYMITLPNKPGILTFGNDYYFEYDKKTATLTKKEKIHKIYYNIASKYGGKKSDPIKSTFHKHKEGDSPFMTSTDVCLLMLYKGSMEWEQHYVYSDKWVSIYVLYNGDLSIVDLKTYQKQTKPKEKDPYENPDQKEEGQ